MNALPADLNPTALAAELKQRFGFDSFRPGQQEVVCDILRGRDVLAIMPTGGGKSLCFQLPALLSPGVCVVISPLIALMQDQVRLLLDNGIDAGASADGARRAATCSLGISGTSSARSSVAGTRLATGESRSAFGAADLVGCCAIGSVGGGRAEVTA